MSQWWTTGADKWGETTERVHYPDPDNAMPNGEHGDVYNPPDEAPHGYPASGKLNDSTWTVTRECTTYHPWGGEPYPAGMCAYQRAIGRGAMTSSGWDPNPRLDGLTRFTQAEWDSMKRALVDGNPIPCPRKAARGCLGCPVPAVEPEHRSHGFPADEGRRRRMNVTHAFSAMCDQEKWARDGSVVMAGPPTERPIRIGNLEIYL